MFLLVGFGWYKQCYCMFIVSKLPHANGWTLTINSLIGQLKDLWHRVRSCATRIRMRHQGVVVVDEKRLQSWWVAQRKLSPICSNLPSSGHCDKWYIHDREGERQEEWEERDTRELLKEKPNGFLIENYCGRHVNSGAHSWPQGSDPTVWGNVSGSRL